jgi:Ca2+-transporting ATPase
VRFLAQFHDLLVILLLIATAIAAGLWAYERDADLPYEAIAILSVVLLNATLGYVQESRAEAAVSGPASDVRSGRCGHPQRRTTQHPRRGDRPRRHHQIEDGDTIPADGRLLESAALQTAEAALTESLPVSKDTDVIADEVALGDRPRTLTMIAEGIASHQLSGAGHRRASAG